MSPDYWIATAAVIVSGVSVGLAIAAHLQNAAARRRQARNNVHVELALRHICGGDAASDFDRHVDTAVALTACPNGRVADGYLPGRGQL